MRWLLRASRDEAATGRKAQWPSLFARVLSPLQTRLGLRLLVLTVGAVLIGTAVSSFLTLYIQRTELVESAQASAVRVSSVLQYSLEHAMLSNNSSMVDEMLQAVTGESGVEQVRVIDFRGETHASSVPGEVGRVFAFGDPVCIACHTDGAPRPPSLAGSKMTSSALLNVSLISNREECYACHDSGQRSLGMLLVETPLTDLNARIKVSGLRLALSALITFGLLATVLIPALRASIIRPVERLTHAAAEIGRGNLSFSAGVDRRDELGQLSATFDAMSRKLQTAQNDMAERNVELRMLNEVARAASELLDPQQILELGLKLATGSPGVLAGAIFFRDSDCGRYRLGATYSPAGHQCLNMSCQVQMLALARIVPGQAMLLNEVAAEQVCPEMGKEGQKCTWVNVPLMARGTEVGRMALTTQPGHRLTEQGLAILKAMGEEIGVALANAFEYQRAQYHGAITERDRLAREMHDSLAQALGYLKLKATLTEQLLNEGEIGQAQKNLREVKAIAGETYTDVREAIFGLRHAGAPDADFLGDLQAYLAEYRTHYGLDVALIPTNGYRPAFSSDTGLQVTRIIQEALANIRKHAGVNEASIQIDRVDDRWRISIEDQGRGFDPGSIQSSGPQFLGLQIMRERAESVGAHLDVQARPLEGTRLTLDVPIEN